MTTPAKIALVTGGSRGIGRQTVLSLAERQVDVIFTFNTRATEAEAVAAEATQAGVRAIALQLDTGQASGFEAFAGRLSDALKTLSADRFDFLVNNAGTSSNASLMTATEAELDALFNVHFKGVFLLTQKLVPLINDGGRIVNVSSGLSQHAMVGRAVYGPMKAAVESLTRYMALELGPRRIAVNVVAPGAIATDFSGGMVRDNKAVNDLVASRTALGRAGVPEDVGPMIAALLSEDNRWVNAQRIEVSGGMNL